MLYLRFLDAMHKNVYRRYNYFQYAAAPEHRSAGSRTSVCHAMFSENYVFIFCVVKKIMLTRVLMLKLEV